MGANKSRQAFSPQNLPLLIYPHRVRLKRLFRWGFVFRPARQKAKNFLVYLYRSGFADIYSVPHINLHVKCIETPRNGHIVH